MLGMSWVAERLQEDSAPHSLVVCPHSSYTSRPQWPGRATARVWPCPAAAGVGMQSVVVLTSWAVCQVNSDLCKEPCRDMKANIGEITRHAQYLVHSHWTAQYSTANLGMAGPAAVCNISGVYLTMLCEMHRFYSDVGCSDRDGLVPR
jgi:hypothetical protein